ncbi:MAG: DUF5693 family protein [Proteocatella sp.]
MKINRILAGFMAIGIMFSAVLAYQRFDKELDYKTYEVNMYYSELEKMASQEGISIDQVLENMKDTGITNMLIKEDTIQSLKQNPNYDITTRMSGYDLIVESKDAELIQRVYDGFDKVRKPERAVVLEDENTLRIEGSALDYIEGQILTVGSYGQKTVSASIWKGSALEVSGIGYDQEAINLAKKNGYGVTLSPIYYSDFQDANKSIDRYIDTIDKNNIEPSHILFGGNQVLGYDYLEFKNIQKEADETGEKAVYPELERFATLLEDRDIAVALIESSSQGGYLETDGMMELLKIMDFDAVGSYLTWDFVTNKYDYKIPFHHNGEEISNIMFRGITTRNIRVISMKPFVMDNRYIADPQAYKNVLDNLEKRLSVLDIKPAELNSMPFFSANKLLKIPVAMGIIAAWLMIFDNLLDIKKKKKLYILLGLGTAGAAGIIGLGIMSGIVNQGFALLGAMTMPSLAGCFLVSSLKKIDRQGLGFTKLKAFFKAELMLLMTILICFGSVLFEIAMLTHSRYLLGIETFAGVKFSQMVPMVIIVLMYIAYFGYKRGEDKGENGIRLDDIKRFGNDTIKMWQVAAVGIFGIVLMIFISRSGNSAPEPSTMEVLLRNSLEFIFPARPRTKAIFVGFPFTIIMMYLAYTRRYQFANIAFMILSSIGLVNTVNTFSHTKAPIYLSLYRTGAEVIVGTLVAIFAILMLETIEYFVIKHKNSRKGRVLNEL